MERQHPRQRKQHVSGPGNEREWSRIEGLHEVQYGWQFCGGKERGRDGGQGDRGQGELNVTVL